MTKLTHIWNIWWFYKQKIAIASSHFLSTTSYNSSCVCKVRLCITTKVALLCEKVEIYQPFRGRVWVLNFPVLKRQWERLDFDPERCKTNTGEYTMVLLCSFHKSYNLSAEIGLSSCVYPGKQTWRRRWYRLMHSQLDNESRKHYIFKCS